VRPWYRLPLVVTLLIVSHGIDACAQSSQVWPEVSTFVKMTDQVRFYFLATTVKEGRNSTSGEIGPNVDFYLHPIRNRKYFAGFRLDESKNRFLLLRVGYRYIPTFAGDDPNENRGVFEGTARYPLLRGRVLVSSRNRIDLRFIGGNHSWRYRNRVSLEREFSLGALRVNPYARFEVFYDSRVSKWSRTESVAGASFPAGRWELEGYFDYQHDTGGSSNRTVHAVGAVVNIYLR
jgi:Protein of unknown function (DUF2490)